MYYNTKKNNIHSFEGIILINFLLYTSGIFSYFSTFFIAVLPFIEAKGAIPIGMSLGLSPITSFFCSYIGSLVPIPFLLLLFAPFMEELNKSKKLEKWAKKINNYIGKKTKKITTQQQTSNEKQDKPIKILTLFMFVAIPIPGTGVWSGSLVASALKLNKTQSFFTIAGANFFASLLVFLATFGFFVS